MNIKYKRLLLVASIINVSIGLFLFISGLLEFTGIAETKADNVTETIGIQLSYLIFLSCIFISLAGVTSLVNYKYISHINLQILLGVVSLAWPLFLTISLLFTQLIINIRLVLAVLTSLFYVIAVLIIKISNEETIKTYKFNPSAIIASQGKRTQSIEIGSIINRTQSGKARNTNILQTFSNVATKVSSKQTSKLNVQRLFTGKRRSRVGFAKRLYIGNRRRSVNIVSNLFQGRVRRRRHR